MLLTVNHFANAVVQTSDMMSVKDVQEMLGIPLLGAIPEDEKVGYLLQLKVQACMFMHSLLV